MMRNLLACLLPLSLYLVLVTGVVALPYAADAIDEEVAQAAADPAKGRMLYEKYCQLCHGEEGVGYAADHANALTNPDFLASASDVFLGTAIDRGRPGTPMAAFGWRFGGPLQLNDFYHLIAYLRSFQTEEQVGLDQVVVRGDASAGAGVYSRLCADCHGASGEGKTAVTLNNPLFLATASDGYVRYAIERGRGGTPMLAFGNLLGSREIDDVTRFIRGWTRTVEMVLPTGEVPPSLGQLVVHPDGPEPDFPSLREGRYLSADLVKEAYQAGKRMLLLDARPLSDWLNAHIPGALPVPYYDGKKIIEKLPRDGTWILSYCGCPHAASDQVTDILRSKGFKKTAVIDEGFFVWMERGYPVTFGNNP